MRHNKRLLIIGICLILAISLLLPTTVLGASPDNPSKPDKEKPVPAQNVHIVKKVTEKSGPPIIPPGKDKPSEDEGAATGILGAPVSGGRYAIVVGISNYPGSQNDLAFCDDDAEDVKDALEYAYGFTDIVLLIDLAATRAAILEAIDLIPAEAGEVVFSFSGHGGYGEAEDGDEEAVDEAIFAHDGTKLVPIWDGELRTAFSKFSARVVFLFDSCMAGGMTDLEDSNRVICMASSETGLSYENPRLENGVFTYYFVEQGIMNGYADAYDHDEDGIMAIKRNPGEPDDVAIEEAFDYANDKCRKQEPVISDNFMDDLLP